VTVVYGKCCEGLETGRFISVGTGSGTSRILAFMGPTEVGTPRYHGPFCL